MRCEVSRTRTSAATRLRACLALPSARWASQAAASPWKLAIAARPSFRRGLLAGLVGAERAIQHHAPAKFLIKVPQELGDRWHRPVDCQQIPEALELANHQKRPERLGAIQHLAAHRARLIEVALLNQ